MADIDQKEELFRSLVVNESLPGFDYHHHNFSFRTVFHKTAYYYCCCKCAFEHEFCIYLSNTGEINEDIYERVVQNIVNGECPHVKTAAPQHVRETRIAAIHVAAATGNKDAVKWFLKNYESDTLTDYFDDSGRHDEDTGIFELQPFDIAGSKNKNSIIKVYSKHRVIHERRMVPVLTGWDYDSDTFIVDVVPLREILKRADATSFSGYPRYDPPSYLKSPFRPHFISRNPSGVNMRCHQPHMMPVTRPQFILRNPSGVNARCHQPQRMPMTRTNLNSAVQIPVMRSLGPRLPSHGLLREIRPPLFVQSLGGVNQQNIAENIACKSDSIGSKRGAYDFEMQIMDLSSQLLYHYDESKAEIIDAFKNISIEQRKASRNLNHYLTLPHIRNDFIKTILDLGANVNYIHVPRKTAIDTLLKVKPNNDTTMVREKVALLVGENPDMELHKQSVRRALKRDVQFQGRAKLQTISAYELNGAYKADAQHRGTFGYNGRHDFALNFMGPFLMECGFPTDRKEIEYFLSKEQVDPFCLDDAEIEYIHAFLENPRPLVVLCRDTLRKYFNGRGIQNFVEQVDCPPKIKDIIMLKALLNPVVP